MYYKAPKTDEKVQWVPIVAKSKDWLIGYVSGIQMIESLVLDSLKNNGIEINLRGIDLCLDSSRFNDILENGKRESNCTKEEIKKYYKDLIQEKIDLVKEDHPDNDKVFENCFLEVECVCGLGVYTFKTPKEIPETQFRCGICGSVIIDYTHHDDEEYDYDGQSNERMNHILEELSKRIENDELLDDEDEI